MFITVGNPLSLDEIKDLEWSSNKNKTRANIPICVIDDEKFLLLNNLRNHHFSINEIGDISDIRQVSDYDIVVCDIRGVGKSFGSKHEGGHLIKEINRRYPNKYIISYSGSLFSPSFRKFIEYSDKSIQKDADLANWVDLLDNAIDRLVNPYYKWLRIRESLISDNVDLYTVFLIEQSYIKSIKEGKPVLINRAIKKIDSLGDNNEINIEAIEGLAVFLTKLIVTGVASL